MKASRSSEVNIQACVDAVGGNQFHLILIAADRARKIAQSRHNDSSTEVNYPVITTLLEIQNKKVDSSALRRFK